MSKVVGRNTVSSLQSRGPDGKFSPAPVKRGPGRPTRAREEKYLKTLVQAVSTEEWAQIADRAVEDAKNGDWRARNWLSDYLMGKPTQVVHEIDQRSIHFDLA